MTRADLPWPAPALSPNSRAHWSKAAKARAEAKRTAWALALEAGFPTHCKGPVSVSLRFCPPDARRRDMDNAFASMKASLDGIAEAMCVDDRHFVFTLAWGDKRPGGAVVVEVAE
jgi:crossover junction endodeoxyribonuclease RusA